MSEQSQQRFKLQKIIAKKKNNFMLTKRRSFKKVPAKKLINAVVV